MRVDYGTVVAGEDYQGVSGTAVFAPGATEVAVEVAALGDESSETFFLEISAPVSAHLGDTQGIGFIIADDDCQSLGLT